MYPEASSKVCHGIIIIIIIIMRRRRMRGEEEEKWITSRVMHLDSTTHILHIVIVLSMINAVM
jgi:hypothetical protein